MEITIELPIGKYRRKFSFSILKSKGRFPNQLNPFHVPVLPGPIRSSPITTVARPAMTTNFPISLNKEFGYFSILAKLWPSRGKDTEDI